MSTQFDWQINDPETGPETAAESSWRVNLRRGLLALALILLVGAAVTYVNYRRLAAAQAERRAAVQAVLDIEREGLRTGDGDLFLSVQDRSADWLSTQLQPQNQAVVRAGLTVTRAEQQGLEIWANVTWSDAVGTWQRIAFFRQIGDRLRHGPGSSDYWGETESLSYRWGRLVLHEVDRSAAPAIANFVASRVAEICAEGCREEQRPFDLVLAADWSASALLGEIRLPSPRLLGLTMDGRPGDPFWSELQARLEAHLTPAAIRFAAPASSITQFRTLARSFTVANPHIEVEVVSLADLPDDPALLLAAVDGAYIRPTEPMLAAGSVFDLTDLAATDPALDRADFYDQLWRGAEWRERLWLLPHAASLKLVYYDQKAYREAQIAEPDLLWTWAELEQDMVRLLAAPGNERLQYGLQDVGPDSLFAYAFNWGSRCAQPGTAECERPLSPDQIGAALAWYSDLVNRGIMADVTQLDSAERLRLQVALGTPRRVALWVEEPLNYEHHSQLGPMGLAPFPGAPGLTGVTPLWVLGGVISQSSERPLAVWEWLKFLTYHEVNRSLRLVPARPSITARIEYWRGLPAPLATVLHSAFPFARPVTFAETSVFDWPVVKAVIDGALTPNEAAQLSRSSPHWFGVTGQ